jgi:hypothetical protein
MFKRRLTMNKKVKIIYTIILFSVFIIKSSDIWDASMCSVKTLFVTIADRLTVLTFNDWYNDSKERIHNALCEKLFKSYLEKNKLNDQKSE